MLKLDRVWVQPSWFADTMQMRLYVSAIPPSGHTVAISGDKAWRLRLGNTMRRLPYLVGNYSKVQEELHVVLVIEHAYAYERILIGDC